MAESTTVGVAITDPGLNHIVNHYGSNRAEIYRRIFAILWYGNEVGDSGDGKIPTYVFPDDLKQSIRRRIPSPDAGSRDNDFAVPGRMVYHVTWHDLREAKWPAPPKSCALCRHRPGDKGKPY